jgi:hypothetical protein
MTEEDFRAIPRLAGLPVYDEADASADSITKANGARGYAGVRECATPQEVQDCLNDPALVPLGAIRATPDGTTVVFVYFGRRRN